MAGWWESFFDAEYVRLWEGAECHSRTERELDGLWTVLGLSENSNVLDAPCGYGRISRGLAARGARLVGVDQSADLLAEAERRRGDILVESLRYYRHDLRIPLPEFGFDAALNIFSSLGYGTEADDLAILSTLRAAVRPQGFVFVEANHRDNVVVRLAQNPRPATRHPDGTLMITGRLETTWHWSGPGGMGQKRASLRIYTSTELVRMIEAAGLRLLSLHNGCSQEPFLDVGASIGGRLGVLATRD
jgi:SAM-dependent methyltransferase